MFDTPVNDSIELPSNITISKGDIFRKPRPNFAQCVYSDLAMSAGIATQFICIFPEMFQLRKTHLNLKPGSLIAFFIASSNNWVYNLLTTRNFFDKPTHFDLQKCLCRMKSHMLQNSNNEFRSPQIGCGLDKVEYKIVSMKLVTILKA